MTVVTKHRKSHRSKTTHVLNCIQRVLISDKYRFVLILTDDNQYYARIIESRFFSKHTKTCKLYKYVVVSLW